MSDTVKAAIWHIGNSILGTIRDSLFEDTRFDAENYANSAKRYYLCVNSVRDSAHLLLVNTTVRDSIVTIDPAMNYCESAA